MFDFFGRKTIARLSDQVAELQTIVNATQALTGIDSTSDLWSALGGASSAAGVAVNERSALRVGAVYACVRLISGSISGMPITIYQRTDKGREVIDDHPLAAMLNVQVNASMGAMVAREYMIASVLLHGDAFALVERRGAVPTALRPVHPDYVTVLRKGDRLLYAIREGDKVTGHDQDDIIHITGAGFDGCRSVSVIKQAGLQAIGTSLAADEYAGRYFSNGARPDIVLTHPDNPGEDKIAFIRERWAETYGGVANAHRPAFLAGGAGVKELSVTAEDAQLLETREWQVLDIARLFGVPPHLIGVASKSTSWGSGLTEQTLGFVKFTLQAHMTRFEQEVGRKLLRNPRRRAEHNTSALERGDTKGRFETYRVALGGGAGPGWLSPNEVRQRENLPPMSGGDELIGWSTSNEN